MSPKMMLQRAHQEQSEICKQRKKLTITADSSIGGGGALRLKALFLCQIVRDERRRNFGQVKIFLVTLD